MTSFKIEQVDALVRDGKLPQARLMAQRLMQAAPGDIDVIRLMARVALHQGELKQSLAMCERAFKLAPQSFIVAAEYAQALQIDRRYGQAVAVLEPWVAKHPNSPEIWASLLSAYLQDNQCVKAERAGRRAIECGMNQLPAWTQLSVALLTQGRPEASLMVLQDAARRWPGNYLLVDSMCFLLNYVPNVTNEDMFRAHRAYGEMLTQVIGPQPDRFGGAKRVSTGGKIRVGLISPDLRSHSVAFFVEPFLRHFDRQRFEVYGYQLNMTGDATTARLKSFANKWAVFGYASDEGIIDRIRGDKIDVLIELAGHTNSHCLPAIAMRGAPVQATYIGYPNTTGVQSIDYRIVDAWTDPPGTEQFATEKLLRLDSCFLCYHPPEHAPEPAPPPSSPQGTSPGVVTFGSFNTPSKLNDTVVALWAKVLLAVPNSRLLLKGLTFADSELREVTLARFEAVGIERARIEIHSHLPSPADHLNLYSRIDIGLDPVPYNGTTTTCEALWMGVPVIVLRGTRHAGRVGVSLLNTVGLTECIAEDEAGYVALAKSLANDPARLTAMRTTLRDRVKASPLCDGPGFARRFERAIEQMIAG